MQIKNSEITKIINGRNIQTRKPLRPPKWPINYYTNLKTRSGKTWMLRRGISPLRIITKIMKQPKERVQLNAM